MPVGAGPVATAELARCGGCAVCDEAWAETSRRGVATVIAKSNGITSAMNVFFNIVYDSFGYWWSVEQTMEEVPFSHK